jgi:hypothetical protein
MDELSRAERWFIVGGWAFGAILFGGSTWLVGNEW